MLLLFLRHSYINVNFFGLGPFQQHVVHNANKFVL